MVHASVCRKDWTKMIRPTQRWRKLKCWYEMPVRTERMLSLLERRTLRGVKAYAKTPIRSENPAMPVLVLNKFVPLTGVIYVL